MPSVTAAGSELPPPQNLDKVQVKGTASADKQMREVVAGKLILGRGWLAQSNALSVTEILQRDPAVTVSANGRIGLLGLPGYTQILLDGDQPPRGIDPLALPPAQVERIEIIRGATAETGMAAIAGTINVVRRKLQRTVPLEWSAAFSGPHQQATGRLSAQASWRDEVDGSVLGFSFNAMRRRPVTEGLEAGWLGNDPEQAGWQRSEIQKVRMDSVSFSPRGSWKLSASDKLSLSASLSSAFFEMVDNTRLLAGSERPGAPAAETERHSVWNSSPTLSGTAEWERQLGAAGRWLLRGQLSRTDEANDNHGGLLQADGARQYVQDVSAGLRRSVDLRLQRLALPLADAHKAQWGLQWKQERRSLTQGLSLDGEPGFIDSLYGPQVRAVNRDGSAWVEDDWQWSEGLSLNLGLRYELRERRLDGGSLPLVRKLALWAPSLNATWTLDEGERRSVSLNLSRGFSAPLAVRLSPRPILDPTSSCNSQALCGSNRPESPDRAGNPDLQPERSWGVDLNLESGLRENSSLSVGVGARSIDQLVLQQALRLESVPWSAQPRWVERPINGGRAWSASLSLGFSLALADWVAAPAPKLEATGSLQWARSMLSTVPGPDNRLPDQSPFSARLGLKYVASELPLELRSDWTLHPANWWQDGGGLQRWQSTRRSWSLSGTWRFDPKTKLSLQLAQLLPGTETTVSQWQLAQAFGTRASVRPQPSFTLAWSSSL